MIKFLSRKFIISILIVVISFICPIVYQAMHVSDQVTMLVLGIIGGVGVAYGVINVKDAQVNPPKVGQDATVSRPYYLWPRTIVDHLSDYNKEVRGAGGAPAEAYRVLGRVSEKDARVGASAGKAKARPAERGVYKA